MHACSFKNKTFKIRREDRSRDLASRACKFFVSFQNHTFTQENEQKPKIRSKMGEKRRS